MDDLELPTATGPVSARMAALLRSWFNAIIDGLPMDALHVLRHQCVRADCTSANLEIVAAIERRLDRLRGFPPRGS